LENNDGSIGNQTSGSALWKGSNAKRDKRATRSYGSFFSDRKFVLSNDLGNDKVYSYKYNQISCTVLKVKTVLLLRQEVVQGI
jgi:6-phosphogluconolactonase